MAPIRHIWLLGAVGVIAGWPNLWAAETLPKISSIEQHSEGACSPPIINNQGKVAISCPGVDEKALHYLEDKLQPS
jgi:hypothetical protein